jgi:serine/threonine-protein kinase
MNALLREVCALGLLAPDRARQVAESPSQCDDPAECARRLVEAGLLTSYQARQVLAEKGKRLLVGPYVLLEQIGRGGMAQVFKAEHRLMKRIVALKIASRKSARRNGSAIRVRFRREVEAAGRVHHPGIVAAYDAGQSRGRLYLAMELVEGIDLERLVKDSGPPSIALACEIVRQAAEALRYLHERGLIHRDIKPSNLMLAAPGMTVKLLDLGVARSAESSTGSEEEPCGTPDFMPPESANDPHRTDARGDLYSLGCTFYFLLTGQVPYPGGNWSEKLLRHSLDMPAPVRVLRPETPEEIAAVVERLMARDPDQRYPTAAAVLAVLAAIGTGETSPVASPPVSPSAKPLSPCPQGERGWGEGANASPSSTGEREASGIESESQTGVRTRRRASPRFFSVALAAILSGLALAGGARWFWHQPSESSRPVIETTPPPFQIDGGSVRFATLEEAIAAARDGETITVHSPGPFQSRPLNAQGKALTVRAGPGVRPRIVMNAGDDPWQALISSDRPLILAGLDLELAGNMTRGRRSLTGSVIRCERAPLHLTDCRLKCAVGSVAIVARNAGEVSLRGCRIDAGTVGLSVEVGQGERFLVRMTDTRLTVRAESGAALSLWAPEVRRATRVELELTTNAIHAGRLFALRALPAGVKIEAHGNRFTFGQALLSFTGYADRDAWRGSTVWNGDDNVYEGPAARVWVDGQPVSPSG